MSSAMQSSSKCFLLLFWRENKNVASTAYSYTIISFSHLDTICIDYPHAAVCALSSSSSSSTTTVISRFLLFPRRLSSAALKSARKFCGYCLKSATLCSDYRPCWSLERNWTGTHTHTRRAARNIFHIIYHISSDTKIEFNNNSNVHNIIVKEAKQRKRKLVSFSTLFSRNPFDFNNVAP